MAGQVAPEPVQVLNFSADGYSTQQEARLLELVAGPFDPDLLIIYSGNNEFVERRSYLQDTGASRVVSPASSARP